MHCAVNKTQTNVSGRCVRKNAGRCVKKKYLTHLLFYSKLTNVMEKILEQTLLYDFYGELLTEHQKAVFEDVVLNDYSLSEVAEERGISRQGVHDLIKRCNGILNGYEEKLHLVAKFIETKENVHRINSLTQQFMEDHDIKHIEEIDKISNQILEEF